MFFFQLHYVRFQSIFIESPASYNDRFFLFMARKPPGSFGPNSAAGLPSIGVRYEEVDSVLRMSDMRRLPPVCSIP